MKKNYKKIYFFIKNKIQFKMITSKNLKPIIIILIKFYKTIYKFICKYIIYLYKFKLKNIYKIKFILNYFNFNNIFFFF